MKYLLDTNVVSEWVKPRRDAGVARWLHEADEDELYLSVVTLAELQYGVERLGAGKRRDQLETWIREELTERFAGRVLAVEKRVADAWGKTMARCERAGKRMGVMDGFLAATAQVHELTLVTRDVAAFSEWLPDIFNPWES